MLPQSLRRQLGLLGRVASFRLLFFATLGSGIGNWLAVVALTVDVYDRTGSGAWVSALWIANIVPAIAIGLLLGPLIDRWSRRRLMIGADLARLGVFFLLPFLSSPSAIVVAAFVAGIANWLFRPAVYAGLPNLLDDDDLPAGNALLQATEWVTTAVGPLLGGVLVAASGPDLAYWINAATFLLSALLIVRIPARLLQSEHAISRGHWRDFAQGVGTVLGSRALLTVLVVWSIVQISTGWINVSEIVIAEVSFSSGAFGYGLLWAATGVGLAIGSVIGGAVVERRGVSFLYPAALASMAAATLVVAVSPNVWVAAAAMVASGIGNGAAFVTNVLLVQRGAADTRPRTRVHRDHERELRRARGRHADGGAADRRRRPALGVGDLLGRGGAGDARRRRDDPVARAGAPPGAGRSVEFRPVAGRRDWTQDTLVAGVRAGDTRALARAITLVENADPLAYDLVRELYPETGRAYSIGITGPPGVGKSSLISALVRHVRAQAQTVGVISVDPSSPFTQGALLGDRIRLADHFLDDGVFIRSMGTRGHLGGLSEATLQAMLILDAAGKDLLFLETVGAGQSEVEVISVADTVVLVLMPGSGDSIQALKAGIMEIPDVIAINKMDHPQAKTMVNEVRSILGLDHDRAWKPPIVLTEAMRGENVDVLWDKVVEHRDFPPGGGGAGGATPSQPCVGGLRGGVEPCEVAPRAVGGGGSRAAPAAGRGAAPRARSADGGARDHGEGVQGRRGRWRPRSLTSRRPAPASTASRA